MEILCNHCSDNLLDPGPGRGSRLRLGTALLTPPVHTSVQQSHGAGAWICSGFHVPLPAVCSFGHSVFPGEYQIRTWKLTRT